MSLARYLQELAANGFSEERAGIIALMREAAIVLFEAFPDTLLLVGGANLLLFQQSARHSADLDLVPIGKLPTFDVLKATLEQGLEPLSRLLSLNPLAIEVVDGGLIVRSEGRQLFSIDIGGVGSVITTNNDTHQLEATGLDLSADIRSASRDQLLLLKAEAFLLRRKVKARDAYDIMLLLNRGAELSGNLRDHLADQIIGQFDSDLIRERIELLTPRTCRVDLEQFIPAEEYRALEKSDFQSLKDAVSTVFAEWL
jgi:hypothetical protein